MEETKAKKTPKNTPLNAEEVTQAERDRILAIMYDAWVELEMYRQRGKSRKYRKLAQNQQRAIVYLVDKIGENAN